VIAAFSPLRVFTIVPTIIAGSGVTIRAVREPAGGAPVIG
jgi:hypothetical protein